MRNPLTHPAYGTYDSDLGPYQGRPMDPRTEPDEREWAQLTTAEQRSRLAELPHEELIEQAIEFLFERDQWASRYDRMCILQGIENGYKP
jgi:hypothetical protein